MIALTLTSARDVIQGVLVVVVGVLVRQVWKLEQRMTRLEALDEDEHRRR